MISKPVEPKPTELMEEQRSLTGALVTGVAAGTANAVAQQVVGKLSSLPGKKKK